MPQADLFWGYLPFWIVNYGLALVMWCCVGRYFLMWFVGHHPRNYIWRSFVFMTEWAVRGIGFITPSFVIPSMLPLVTAFWLLFIRLGVFLLMASFGLTPTFSPPSGG
jgi:hypothetical protein